MTLAGNPEPSRIGWRWYYKSEDEENIYLHYDEIVKEYAQFIGIQCVIDTKQGPKVFPHYPIVLDKETYNSLYPASPSFPIPFRSDEEAFTFYQTHPSEGATTS